MTKRTCDCQISYSSLICSFLQLMSKDGMSAFGPDLSGDQEQQVSASEKETNRHFRHSSEQTVGGFRAVV